MRTARRGRPHTTPGRAVHDDEVAVLEQVAGIAAPRRGGVVQQPAHVGVPETADLPTETRAVTVGRVRVARSIGQRVVPAMIGHPPDRAPFEGHRAEDAEGDLQRPGGGEAPVRQQPVEADRHAVTDDDVEGGRQDQVSGADAMPPPADDAVGEGEQRRQDEHRRDQPFRTRLRRCRFGRRLKRGSIGRRQDRPRRRTRRPPSPLLVTVLCPLWDKSWYRPRSGVGPTHVGADRCGDSTVPLVPLRRARRYGRLGRLVTWGGVGGDGLRGVSRCGRMSGVDGVLR